MKYELVSTTSWEVVSSSDGVLSSYLNLRNRHMIDDLVMGVEDILQEAVIRAEAGVRA